MAIAQYAIAAGWNAASLTNIEHLTPSGAVANWLNPATNSYLFVRGLGNYSTPLVQTSGLSLVQQGLVSVQWELAGAKYDSIAWFISTYIQATSGKCTAKLKVLTDTYVNKNVLISADFTQLRDMQKRYRTSGTWALDMVLTLLIVGDPS